MSLIQIQNLSFAYDGSYDDVFKDVSIQLDTDWKLGLIGRNGRGKTTFLNLLHGKYEYSGRIISEANFEYFPYTLQNKQRNTLEIIREICPDCMDWEISYELSQIDVDDAILSRPFACLSNGEQTKLLLAALFLVSNAFLLLDEPTNHLDAAGRRSVKKYLKKKKGFILVSHDRDLLDACVDHVLSINRNDIEIQKGNFSTWYQNKAQQDHYEFMQNEKQKKEIARLSSAARQSKQWSDQVEKTKNATRNSGIKPDKGHVGHMAAKMMKRSKNIEARQKSAIEEKSKLLKNLEKTDSLKLSPLKHWNQTLLMLKDVSIQYGTRPVCGPVSFTVAQGDRIAIQGKNGAGKTSILKLLRGEAIPYQGEFHPASGLILSDVPQDTSFLCGSLTAYAEAQRLEETLFKSILAKLDFSRKQFEKDLSDFSEGQKKKVLLAKSLCQKANLYIWDEPLNYVDLLSRIQIETLILKDCPTMVFVEHDSEFVKKIATKTVVLTS